MDPQERLFLQASWEVLEDAGHSREALSTRHRGRVGVYAGITKRGFELYGPPLWSRGERDLPHTSFGSVANRVSYVLDLHGPSLPIDTMCSASLTAIHEACEHLLRGECEAALAGGVNLYLHPSTYVELCAQRMLSSDGRCSSFGEGGDGYVPGEGVGVALLKPLKAAEADGDHIYGVILGTSINHGGTHERIHGTEPAGARRPDCRSACARRKWMRGRSATSKRTGRGRRSGIRSRYRGLSQAFGTCTQDEAVLRDRIGEEQHRASRERGGDRRAHQGAAADEARGAGAEPACAGAESAH